ncbi:MAG: NCS2 family permease [Lachnospiraceae bacterium]|nr:NCS2 family permease [Lachnospiraceae bacterium]
MLERVFHLKENNTNVKTEVIAGITTFLAMAYILAVNPTILGNVMNRNGVFLATAIASAAATFIMGILANYPIALSAGMGINAYFAYTVCLGELGGEANAFTVALTAVFVEGVIFIILSLIKAREQIINGIPQNLKFGITAGLGIFIAFLGLTAAKIVVPNEGTTIGLGNLASPEVALALLGFVIIVILSHYKVKGSVLLGIIITWVLGMIAESTGWYVVDVESGVYSVFPSFTGGLDFSGLSETAFHFNFEWAATHIIQFIAILVSLLYVDLFDTVGTVIGVADKANLLDKEGKLPRIGQVFLADSIGTVIGACLGTSTITSFVESSAGVSEGGRTGLTAITTGFLFLISIFLSPLFLAVPSFATTPALIYVGMLMISSAKKIDYESDLGDVAGAYLAMIMIPLSASISTGIMLAIIVWTLIKIFTGKAKDVSVVMWVLFILFMCRVLALVFNFQ